MALDIADHAIISAFMYMFYLQLVSNKQSITLLRHVALWPSTDWRCTNVKHLALVATAYT